jgi:hypothetical protein
MEKLTIEYLKEHGMIAYEYVRGSHAYGTNIKDENGNDISDTDIGGVFICPESTLKGLRSGYVEQVADEKNDTVYYELGRWVELLMKSNPTALESLFIPKDCVIGEIHPAVQYILEHKDLFITKECLNPLLGYSFNQIKKAKGLNKKINIPEDQFLSHVDYNPQTKEITFTFADGTVLSPIYIGDLIDTYTAGNGIEISGNQVSAKVDSQSEPFLSVTAGGLKLSGIQTAIDKRYQAGLGLKRSAQPNAEGEYTFDVQIQENSRPYLGADVDGIGLDLNALAEAIGNDFDPSTLAGKHLTYNAGKLDVDVASLVADPDFVTAVTDIVNNALLWEVKDANQIQPKDGKSVYVAGTIEATGAIYSGQ